MAKNICITLDNGGAPSDVSNLGKTKTLSIDSSFQGLVTIEAKGEGGDFVAVPDGTFQAPGSKTIEGVFGEMRVAGSFSGTPVISVSAEAADPKFVDLPSGGAAVDTDNLGSFNTVVVSGMSAGDLLKVQISDDGVNFSDWKTFQADGTLSDEVVTCWMRVQYVGSGAPVISVGATDTGEGANGVATSFVWSPDNPNAVGSGVFTAPGLPGFKACFDACRAALAGGSIKVAFVFDNSYSTDLDFLGSPTCRVPTAVAEPNAVWDFEGIVIDGGWSNPGGGGVGVSITNADGGIIQPLSGDIWINIAFGNIINESVIYSLFEASPGWGVCQGDGNTVRYVVKPGAAPLIHPDLTADFMYLCTGMNGLGGLGLGPDPSPDVIYDARGKLCLNSAEGTSQWVVDNAYGDSVGGGDIDQLGPFRNGRFNNMLGEHPALGELNAAGSAGFRNRQVMGQKIPVMYNQFAPGTPITVDDTLLEPGINYVDTTAGDVTVKVPFTNPQSGQDIYVHCLAGNANKCIVTAEGPNVRNIGGVADSIDTPDVASGTKARFIGNGGMDGTGIGTYERWL